MPSSPELPLQETSIADLKPCLSTEPSRPKRISQAVLLAVAIAMGLTVISGIAYVTVAKLGVQQRSQESTVEPKQSRSHQIEQTIPTVESTPYEQASLAEAPAIMHLDRAQRLAAANRVEDAIVEATKIPASSLFYQQAQKAISQWSNEALQYKAEQRAVQQKLQAMDEDNQQHLQLAQQALDRDDWETALDEAKQINVSQTNQNPFWQQQRDAMVQTIEPYQHEHKAWKFLDDDELDNAVYEANQLPQVEPWEEKKDIIIEQVEQKFADKRVAKKWKTRCQRLTQENISRCPSLDELKGVAELLPSARWLPGLNSPDRKSKH